MSEGDMFIARYLLEKISLLGLTLNFLLVPGIIQFLTIRFLVNWCQQKSIQL